MRTRPKQLLRAIFMAASFACAGCAIHSTNYIHLEGANAAGGRVCQANVPETSSFQAAGATVVVHMDFEAKPGGSWLNILAPRGTKVSLPNSFVEISAGGSTASLVPLRYSGVVESTGVLRPYSSSPFSPPVGRDDVYPFRFTRPPASRDGSLRLPEISVGDTKIPARLLRYEERTHTWINCV